MTKPLPTAILGRTGLRVTRLGYGAAHRKPQSDENAKAVHEAVLDSGINFIDTADDYGNSEELIGQYMSARSGEYHIATKCGGSESGHVWTRENCLRTMEDSLKRLRTDSIDIMQLHNPSVAESEAGGLVDALKEMRDSGNVRWIGASTTLPHLPTYLSWDVFDVFQIPYSALEREHEDWITKAAEAGVGIVIRGGVAMGEPGVGKGSVDQWRRFEEAGLDGLLDDDEDRTTFLLRYTLTHPHADTIIVGTVNLDHLRQNVEAIHKGPLTDDVYAETKRRLDAIGISPAPVI
jgi:aryl-alcohol dehydrogenase-like predicted oxidoreductase